MLRLLCTVLLPIHVCVECYFVLPDGPTDVTTSYPGYDKQQDSIQIKALYGAASGFATLNINPYFLLLAMSNDPKTSSVTHYSYYRYKKKRGRASSKQGSFFDNIIKREFLMPKEQVWSDRKTEISRNRMRQFPYANIVQLSCGCTGTLLTPYHVITAAHCVHDRTDFKENIEMLKVHVPDKYGYRVHYVVKINVPVMWMRSQMIPEYAYDYAILQLNLPVIGRDKYMQLALPTTRTKYTDLHFFGFFPDESNGLWESTCSAENNRFVYGGNAVLTECETTAGNSGAAVFAEDSVDGDKIIGILSSSLGLYGDTELEAIMLLTLSKCLDICAMIYPEGEKYDVCLQVKRHEMRYLQVGSNRIMPFFG